MDMDAFTETGCEVFFAVVNQVFSPSSSCHLNSQKRQNELSRIIVTAFLLFFFAAAVELTRVELFFSEYLAGRPPEEERPLLARSTQVLFFCCRRQSGFTCALCTSDKRFFLQHSYLT